MNMTKCLYVYARMLHYVDISISLTSNANKDSNGCHLCYGRDIRLHYYVGSVNRDTFLFLRFENDVTTLFNRLHHA